jgi:hypothetical protein
MLSPCGLNITGNIYFRRSVSYIVFVYAISYNANSPPTSWWCGDNTDHEQIFIVYKWD